MDWSSIIVAAIAALGSYAGSSAVARKKSQEDAIKDAEREQRHEDQLQVINKKLDEHNGYAKKFGEIEKSVVGIQKDIEYIKKGIK